MGIPILFVSICKENPSEMLNIVYTLLIVLSQYFDITTQSFAVADLFLQLRKFFFYVVVFPVVFMSNVST